MTAHRCVMSLSAFLFPRGAGDLNGGGERALSFGEEVCYNRGQTAAKRGEGVFGKLFDPFNGFWRGLGRVCDIVGLSVCWAVCSLPVFTVGAATAALYDAVFHGVRQGELGDYARFFRTFRDSFRTATVLTVPALALAAGLYYMWYVAFVMASGGSAAAMVWLHACRILLLVPLAVWLFAMFTLSRFAFHAKELAVTAAKLVMAHLPSAAVTALLVEELALFTYKKVFLPGFFTPGLAALLCSLFMERIFAPYLPKEEAEGEEEQEQ